MAHQVPVRLAVVGCGAIANLHAERLRVDGRAVIAVCCDPSIERARAFAQSFAPKAKIETDPLRTLSQTGLDAAILCSPTQSHHLQVKTALRNGLHVLCEKPLAVGTEEIGDLLRARDESGRILAISYQRRHEAPYVTAKTEIQTRPEIYGRIRQIHLFVCERWQQTIAGTWRDDPKVGAGYFGDAGSHQVDCCFYITGAAPLALFARSDKRDSQVEIVTQVLATLTGGIDLLAHFVGDAHHFREDIHFHGEKADLLIRGGRLFRAEKNRVQEITELQQPSDPDQAFLDSILTRAPLLAPAECALPMASWTNAVLESARTSRWIEIAKP